MPSIDPSKNLVTLVNIFLVASPNEQSALIDSLRRATEDVMQSLPGFVAASVHRSLDGERVLNYAQWEGMDQFRAMLANPAVRPHMGEVKELAKHIEPILYEVAYVFEKPAS